MTLPDIEDLLFKFINHKDPLLGTVMDMGKKNSVTLGLMPRDAFIQQARKNCIVVTYHGNNLVGYCLFRVAETKRRVSITQLCIDPLYRKKGISKLLLNQIKEKYNSVLNGMLVSCRTDYVDACHMWRAYGFVEEKRVRGRGIQETELIKFWYGFTPLHLFATHIASKNLKVVLDLNIIIKLRDQDESEEIRQLLADWLVNEVDYCYAQEVLSEIERDKDSKRAHETRQFIKSFEELSSNYDEVQELQALLLDLHPGNSENHHSDRNQLAECKVCRIAYFITNDQELIDRREMIYDRILVKVLRPGEFILEIDELKNGELYEPLRLQGADYDVKKVDSTEVLEIIEIFLSKSTSEKKIEFKKRVLGLISDVKNSRVQLITSINGNYIATYGYRFLEGCIKVEFVRIKEMPIANTLFYQIIVELVRQTIRADREEISIEDQDVTQDQREILADNGFYKRGNHWLKIALRSVCEFEYLKSLHPIIKNHPEIIKTLDVIDAQVDLKVKDLLQLEIEKKLWPLKLANLDIPTFIIPVKPIWASQLFDYISSNESLFPAKAQLSWARENVYYRSAMPNIESAPARILWYASEEKGFTRSKSIVACSYLNDSIINEAKFLFIAFRRFGVYQWKDVLKLAKGQAHGTIKVLKFSDTEVFKTMIGFHKLNEILNRNFIKSQTIVSPVKVNHKVFNEVYSIGMGMK